MEKISKQVLQSAQQYLEWDFGHHKKKGEEGTEENVWNSQRLLEERYIKNKVAGILKKQGLDSQAVVGEIQQLLR